MNKEENKKLDFLIDEIRQIKIVLVGNPEMGTEEQGLVSRQKADEKYKESMNKKVNEIHDMVKTHDKRFEEVKDVLEFVKIAKWFKSKKAAIGTGILGFIAAIKYYWHEIEIFFNQN